MPQFTLYTHIEAPIEICFDLARSIDLHLETMKHTNETAVAGVKSGLINLGEAVTWKAKHFGIVTKLTSKITACEFPKLFSDVMVRGPFKSMFHQHVFEQKEGYTLMTDHFQFESPFGVLGKLVNELVLTKYMLNLIEKRNQVIKQSAENTYNR
ncbi:MAG: hypothetical protein JWN56_1932 [Sphingobacteriales bacterium]|nr:hypothetical protein [Sphingobacteriales bacterium]